MKAIGARRRDQIRRIYLRTALLLGAAWGALARRRARDMLLVSVLRRVSSPPRSSASAPASAVDLRALVASIVAGVVGPPLAALPGDPPRARLPLDEALQAIRVGRSAAEGRRGRRCCAACGFLPRDRADRLARCSAAASGAAIATALQISVAVATCSRSYRSVHGIGKTGRAWNSYETTSTRDRRSSKPLGQLPAADRLYRRRARGAAEDAEQRQARRPGRPGVGAARAAADEHFHLDSGLLVHRRGGRAPRAGGRARADIAVAEDHRQGQSATMVRHSSRQRPCDVAA